MDLEQRKITKIHDFCMDFDRHAEETNVDALPNAITRTGKNYLRKPCTNPVARLDTHNFSNSRHKGKLRETAIEQ